MEKKYLGYQGLQDVASHVNTRLKTVTTIPASADDGAVRLYVGETGVTYKKGHIYQYNATDLEWVDITSSSEYTAGNGIDITDNEISVETYIFTGTQAQWDALTTEQKKEYDICNITDDASSDDEIYTKSEIDAILDDVYTKTEADALLDEKLSYADNGILGAKNLLKNTAVNKTGGNVAWVVNADKSITINTSESASSVQTLYIGEVTGLQGDYILNGVTGGSLSTYGIQLYDVTTSTWITQYAVDGDSTINLADKSHTYRFVAYVREGVSVSNITIRPMLRLATDTDPTYVPYVPTNAKLNEEKMSYADNGVLGAKNFWSWQITNQTKNGVTWTQNTDGSVLANGATTDAQSDMYSLKFTFKKAGKYILTGKSNNVEVGLYNFQTSKWYWSNNTHPSILIDVPNTTDEWWFSVVVRTNKTVNNETIYPMLRLASDPDDTYQPYAMTNRELTEGAGLPKKTLIRTLADGKITVTIPKNLGSSYAQGSLKLIGSNADSEAHVTFCLNSDNTAVSVSKLTNLGSKALTLDSASISGNNLVLKISGVQNYAWASAEYFMSLSDGANAVQPTWTFAGS